MQWYKNFWKKHFMHFKNYLLKRSSLCLIVILNHLLLLKDVMMLGAVGAYAWSGTVVHQKGSRVDVLPFSAFEATLQDRNHSSLLGNDSLTLCCGSSVEGVP